MMKMVIKKENDDHDKYDDNVDDDDNYDDNDDDDDN